MKQKSWKLACSLAAIFSAGTIFAGCETSETVTVAAGPGGSALIVEECDSTSSCPAAQKAKSAMQTPAAQNNNKAAAPAAKDSQCSKDDKKCDKDKECKTVEVARKHSCPMEKFEAESTKLASTLANAFKNGDAKAFVHALPEDMRKDFDEKKFLEAHKMMTDAMGEAFSAEFVTDLKHPVLSIKLWKIGFKKTGKESGELVQQALFQVTIGEVDKKAQVVSFGFI